MHARARADQDVVRVALLDRDPRDRTVVGDGERAVDAGPVGAVVARLVEAEPSLAVAAGVSFTGADVDRLAGRVVRIDGDRADRVRRDPVGDLLPGGVLGQRVLRPPEPAAGRAQIEGALLRLALRVDGQRRDAARPLGRLDERLRAEPVDVEGVGADEVPLRAQLRPAGGGRVVRGERALDLVHADLVARVGPVGVRLCVRATTGLLTALALEDGRVREARGDSLRGCGLRMRVVREQQRHGRQRSDHDQDGGRPPEELGHHAALSFEEEVPILPRRRTQSQPPGVISRRAIALWRSLRGL